MGYFSGRYDSYSNGSTIYGSAGTERTVTLCPDGRYLDSYDEFSTSGFELEGRARGPPVPSRVLDLEKCDVLERK
jgi:hypothetical protein